MSDILLTGSTGYLGSAILKKFISNGVAVDTLGRSIDNTVIIDSDSAIIMPKAYKRIIHIAGLTPNKTFFENKWEDYYNSNVKYLENICNSLDASGCFPQQIVLVSSVSVYGLIRGENIDEETPLLGKTNYAKSKIQAEQFLLEWGRKFNVKILILRLPIVIGDEFNGLLSLLSRAIKSGLYLRIGNGEAKKSVLLLDDLATFILLYEKEEGVFNLTSGKSLSFRVIEEHLCGYYNKAHPRSVPMSLAVFLLCVFKILNIKKGVDLIEKLIYSLTFSDQKVRMNLNWQPSDLNNIFKRDQ